MYLCNFLNTFWGGPRPSDPPQTWSIVNAYFEFRLLNKRTRSKRNRKQFVSFIIGTRDKLKNIKRVSYFVKMLDF